MSLIAPIRAAIFGVTLPRTDPSYGLVPRVWSQFFQALADGVEVASGRLGRFSTAAATATTITTDFVTSPPTLTAGMVRASSYVQIITPASVSSSVTVRFGWTYNGVAQTETAAAVNGNTTTTHQSFTAVMLIDAGTAVNYRAVYASSGTPMTYALDVYLEQLP